MVDVNASAKTRILIGSDDAGYQLKEHIKAHLESAGIQVDDFGCDAGEAVDYPDIAFAVARSIAATPESRGILICGTGIGMAIAANKVRGIYAAQAHDTYSAERAAKSNNAHILTMGARVVGPQLAEMIVDAWLRSEFQGGNSTRKVKKISENDLGGTEPTSSDATGAQGDGGLADKERA